MSFSVIASLFGGIGLFLLGMRMMTQGLKVAAGRALRSILSQWTKSPLRGLMAGFFITALVQSSSAITVAVIGFANAGLLSLGQTIGVIFGSNIGTTVTGWIVAAVGLSLKVKLLALPLIGIGSFLRVFTSSSRKQALGDALAGFGLFFLGITIMQQGFGGLEEIIPPEVLSQPGALGYVAAVGVGFLLTLIMQSSSAAMALVLTAGAGGAISLPLAASCVIGTNIGTTSTALLSVIGATPNAKKVAAAHVIFNIITGAAALILLPVLLKLVVLVADAVGMGNDQTAVLALFHTAFNILGVLLLAPFIGKLVWILEHWIGSRIPDLGKPRYLDKNVLATPDLALDALTLELAGMGGVARKIIRDIMYPTPEAGVKIATEKAALQNLILACREYASKLQQGNIPPRVAGRLPLALRVVQYLATIAELSSLAAKQRKGLRLEIGSSHLDQASQQFTAKCEYLLQIASAPCSKEFMQAEELLTDLSESYHRLKAQLLETGARSELAISLMVHYLDYYSTLRRMINQSVKASIHWSIIQNRTDLCPADATDDDDDGPGGGSESRDDGRKRKTDTGFAWNQPW